MERRKIVAESTLLARPFHVDGFVAGTAPRFSMLFFGGSGVTEAVYWERRATVVPVFNRALETLERSESFGFVFVTAPFDVPFRRFPDDPVAAEQWSAHVRTELLPAVVRAFPALADLPRYVAGYSGGAALALAGHHLDAACFGVGLLGADGLDPTVSVASSWPEPITLYYNREDDVLRANVEIVRALESDGRAASFRHLPGGHALEDYVANESFGGLIRRGARTLPGPARRA